MLVKIALPRLPINLIRSHHAYSSVLWIDQVFASISGGLGMRASSMLLANHRWQIQNRPLCLFYSMKIGKLFFACVMGVINNADAAAEKLPKDILDQLPGGYEVLSTAQGLLDGDKLDDVLVVVHKRNEEALARNGMAPSRPLLIFTQNSGGSYNLARRNDHVVLKINEGGQCDPFEDGEDGLIINKHYFTIQHSVACGQHWRWYITFKYERQLHDWIFHKAVSEGWILNSSADPNADALLPGRGSVISGKGKAPVLFEKYRDGH